MARFPIQQASVLQLAEAMGAGLAANAAVYPAPPVAAADLAAQLSACRSAFEAVAAARAAYDLALAQKDEQLVRLTGMMKKDLRYAENTTGFDDDKLKMLGWAGKKAPSAMAVPGQVRKLRAVEQGTDCVTLRWIAPVDGGKPAAYEIFRRDGTSDAWAHVGVSMTTTLQLPDQPRHIDLEYRVTALNKTGSGPVSNTVTVVL